MDFRTELVIKPSSWNIVHNDAVFTIGSCFAETIGNRFVGSKFPAVVNPFGTTYHPSAIHKIIDYAVSGESPEPETYLERNGLHLNYDFHSSLAASSQENLMQAIDATIAGSHSFITKSKVLIVTYGTAFVYERIDNNQKVANCHKVPATSFSKRLSNISDIIQSFDKMISGLRKLNPSIKIILTVSPARHTKDSIELNSVSKSLLRTACHDISEKHQDVEYFPSFEIMMDDLRDYRFYKSDLIHPTEMAEDYIWNKFSERYFSSDTRNLIAKWNDVRNALAHRPFQPEGSAYQKFQEDTLIRLQELESFIDVSAEINKLKAESRKPKAHDS